MKIKVSICHLKDSRMNVFFIWFILTWININKAYHIDDTFHLLAAENIENTPCNPMSGLINWDNGLLPGYHFNQPPLFFYLIAATNYIAGNDEMAMHLMLSLFTFISLYYFAKLANILKSNSTVTLLLMFGFCPALVVNQNLMTDIPILAISIMFVYFVIKGQIVQKIKYYVIAATLLGFGLLVKYTLLALFPILFISTIISGQFKKTAVLLIPIIILVLWSAWNMAEFNAIHILTREKGIFNVKKIIAFAGTLGSISTFSLLFARKYLTKNKIVYTAIFTLCYLATCLLLMYLYGNITTDLIVSMLFILNGTAVIFGIVYKSVSLSIIEGYNFIKTPYFIILMTIAGFACFILLFAPFNATRHILLIIPFLILFGDKYFFNQFGFLKKLTVFLTIILGLLIGLSDWLFADFYRQSAKQINTKNQTAWSLGLWGWQWYSQEAGMKIYSTEDEKKLKKGDLIVYPTHVPKQQFNTNIKVDTIQLIIHKPSLLNLVSVKNGSMYHSFITKPAWTLSCKPIDTIIVGKIKTL